MSIKKEVPPWTFIVFLWYGQIKETKEQVLLALKKMYIFLETFNNVLDLYPQNPHTQTHTPSDAWWPGLLVCIHFPHGAIRQRWSTQVMEQLRTQSAQVETSVLPSSRLNCSQWQTYSLTPHSKHKSTSTKLPEASHCCSNNPLFTGLSLCLFYEYGLCPSCSITWVNMDVSNPNIWVKS